MKPDRFPDPVLTGCDAVQYQLSELADSGAPLPPELRAHLDGCDACAGFAAQWLDGPPAALARPVAGDTRADDALRARILDAAAPAPANVVPFAPSPAAGRPTVRSVWLGRAAACAVFAGFAYYLLDPAVAPVGGGPGAEAKPTLAQNVLKVEGRAKREQQVVGTALRDGGRQVSHNVAWSASALEL